MWTFFNSFYAYKSTQAKTMTNLLKEIEGISKEAANELEKLDFRTDSDIRSLTQSDLQELLPGCSNIRVRKKIYDTIHKQRPIHAVLDELKSFVPDESLRDALSSNGALQDYLQILKGLKSEVSRVQEFLDAHIDLLENVGQSQYKKPQDQAVVTSVNHAPAASSAAIAHTSNAAHHFERDYNSRAPISPNTLPVQPNPVAQPISRPLTQATVTYKMFVSGNTLNRHLDVLEKLKGPVQSDHAVSLNLQQTRHDEESRVIIVFCPVVSRLQSDVEAAINGISGNKPVILVLMHHNHTVQSSPTVKTKPYVVLVVNVFFHETVPGLLKCEQNDEAVSAIQTKLLVYTTRTGTYSRFQW